MEKVIMEKLSWKEDLNQVFQFESLFWECKYYLKSKQTVFL